MRKRQPIAIRFWSKVDKSGGPDACWPWLAYKVGKYGRMTTTKGHTEYAHRLAYMLERGEIPDGLCVCHHCDNPPCCNPAHFFLGTNADNTADMIAKGRHAHGPRANKENAVRGVSHYRAKLTDERVLSIRAMHASGQSQRAIGKAMSVDRRTVQRVLRGENWRHVV